jgi:hypothetical protein
LREVLKDDDYQAVNESLQWPRCELGYGKNVSYDKETNKPYASFKRRGHRGTLVPLEIDNPQPSSYDHNDKIMEKVQRLNGFGSEEINHLC